MKKISLVLLFLLSFKLLICADENSNSNQTYEDQLLEKRINEIVEKRLKEKEELKNSSESKKESMKKK